MNETQSCRLTRSERQYFDEYWDGNFSPWVHNKVKEDLKKINGNIIRNKFQNYTYGMVMMAIGAMCWFFSATQDNPFTTILTVLVGLLFVVSGGITLVLELKKHD